MADYSIWSLEYGEIADYPAPHRRFFLTKRL